MSYDKHMDRFEITSGCVDPIRRGQSPLYNMIQLTLFDLSS